MNTESDIKTKFILLGVDSASLRVIEPLVKDGRLPAIAKMMSNGAYGHLKSSVPMLSPSLWTSITTGRNPGEHGLYDFLFLSEKNNKTIYNSSRNRKVPPIWKILSEMDKKVCVSGVMMTYPADKVNGCMTSAILNSPNPQRNSSRGPGTYPLELEAELDKAVGACPFKTMERPNTEELSKSLLNCTEHRKKLYKYLSSKDEYDFRMFFFPETDFMSHLVWKMIEEGDKKGSEFLYQIYVSIDKYIAELMKEPDTNLMIVSDHGAKALKRIVSLNNILVDKGYLKYNRPNPIIDIIHKVTKRLYNRIFIRGKRPFLPQMDDMARVINWKKTRVYSFGTTAGNIFINQKGNTERGIVDPADYEKLRGEIKEMLLKVKDPDNGQLTVDKVYMKEELFTGKALKNAPDMCVTFRDGYGVKITADDVHHPNVLVRDNEEWCGDHDINGVIIAHGPQFISNSKPDNASLFDVAPTVFAAMGLPVPSEMDGRVLKEILNTEYKISETKTNNDNAEDNNPSDEVYDEEEESAIEDRLTELGYM